jgi:hypothetical protein
MSETTTALPLIGTVWGGVTVNGRRQPAYVSDAGWFTARPGGGAWGEMSATERASFVPDWVRTVCRAHTDAWYEELRRARLSGDRARVRVAVAGVNRAHGWGS